MACGMPSVLYALLRHHCKTALPWLPNLPTLPALPLLTDAPVAKTHRTRLLLSLPASAVAALHNAADLHYNGRVNDALRAVLAVAAARDPNGDRTGIRVLETELISSSTLTGSVTSDFFDKGCHRRTHSDTWSFTSAVSDEDLDGFATPEQPDFDENQLDADHSERAVLQRVADFVALPASLGATQMAWLRKAGKVRGCDTSAVLRSVFAELWRERVPVFPGGQPLPHL